MSNVIEKQTLEEGFRNAVVKISGVLDSGDENRTEIIALRDFTNNEQRQKLIGLRVDQVNYSLGQVLDVALYWQSDTPQQIVPLSKSGKMPFADDGGLLPDMTRSGYTGGINLVATGWATGQGAKQNFTILLRLVKLYTGNF